jgi:hypothetical protein
MIGGLLMLLVPNVIFFATLPASRRLKPQLRLLYLIVGGAIVIAGSIFSLYLAAYTGDQGGIGAFFFQIAVIVVYVLFSILLVAINWILHMRGQQRYES